MESNSYPTELARLGSYCFTLITERGAVFIPYSPLSSLVLLSFSHFPRWCWDRDFFSISLLSSTNAPGNVVVAWRGDSGVGREAAAAAGRRGASASFFRGFALR